MANNYGIVYIVQLSCTLEVVMLLSHCTMYVYMNSNYCVRDGGKESVQYCMFVYWTCPSLICNMMKEFLTYIQRGRKGERKSERIQDSSEI